MRPRYLELEGLQSFRDLQVIDFDRLGETGLFGIFGPTGSGKSTVLDAITLALYGNVQRAVRGTQGIINTGAASVRVAFVFDLLKENTRKTYRVERIYRRKKDSENSVEARIARLFEIIGDGDRIIADRPGDVTARVEELLGLQLDDFTRSVVLPQNKFQEFLLLEKAKKREMLERIFYLEEYGRHLTEKVAKKLSAVRIKLSSLEGAMSTLGDASEKALTEAESNMQSARERKERLDEELKLLEGQFNEAKEVWDLVSELNLVMEREKEHLSKLGEINEKKKLHENAVKAEGLVDFINKYRETEKNLAQTLSMLEEVDRQLPELETALNEARARFEACREESEREKPGLIEQKAKLNNALGIKAETIEIEKKLDILRKSYTALKDQIASKDSGINARKAELEDIEKKLVECKIHIDKSKIDIDYRNGIHAGVKLEDDLNSTKRDRENLQSKYNELSLRISQLESKLEEVISQKQAAEKSLEKLKSRQAEHECSKPGVRGEIMQAFDNYHTIRSTCEALKSKKLDMDEMNAKIANVKLQIERLSAVCGEAELTRKKLAARLDCCRREIEGLKQQYEKHTAYLLAKSLTEGEPCPVCGSDHHPSPASRAENGQIDDIAGSLKKAQEQLDETEKEHRKAENDFIKLNEQLRGLNSQLNQIICDLELKAEEYKKTAESLPLHMRDMTPELMEAEMESIAARNEKRLKELEDWEAMLEQLKNDLLKHNDVLSGLTAEEKGRRAELQVLKENLALTVHSLNESVQSLDKKQTLYNEFIQRFKIDDIGSELKRIEECDRVVEKLQRQVEQYQSLAKEIRNRLDMLLEERQQLGSKFADVDADGRNLKTRKIENEQKIRQLAGDKDTDAEIKAVDERINMLILKEKQLFENVKKQEVSFNDLSMRKTALENQKEIYSKNLEYERQRVRNLLKEKGFENFDEAQNSILTGEEKERLDMHIKEYEKVQRNLQAHREMIEKKLGSRSITEEEWRIINEDYTAKKQEKENVISLYESARNIYNNTKKNFEKWLELDKEYQKYSRKNEMLEHIQKLLKGNSFIEFISEERLRYIAKEATEILGVLTKYRYALELDTEHGFVVRDNANGGVHRLVSSLSGGETFLTSLSLALALSKQIQLKGQSPLEFFFLDEGFGTLDGNLLDSVIDSLESLSSKERVIGLISHVPELKNRIARRLIVEPPTSDGSGSRVRIEKA